MSEALFLADLLGFSDDVGCQSKPPENFAAWAPDCGSKRLFKQTFQ
jgi:hypothetical protein